MPRRISTLAPMIGCLFFVGLLFPSQSKAQFAIGGGYELRDEEPKTGYMVMIENGFLKRFPMISLKTRLHLSVFADEISVRDQAVLDQLELSETEQFLSQVDSYDFGLAVLMGVNLGIVKPYGGVGLGNESYKIDYAIPSSVTVPPDFQQSLSDNGFYGNIFVGTEISPIPLLKPFVEYRFSTFLTDEEINYSQNGRISLGLKLQF